MNDVYKCVFFQESRMTSGETSPSVMAHHMSGYMEAQGISLRQQFPVERKWALGLQVTQVVWALCLWSAFISSCDEDAFSCVFPN